MLVNARTGGIVARDVELADTRATRRRGLLGRPGLDPAAALVISPCFSIHTFFMQFPIDVIFVNRDGVAVRIVHNLPPGRMATSFRARAVIELAAGGLKERDVQVGDRLYLAAREAVPGTAVSWPIPA